MAITGSQPSYMYALGGYARGGATRGGDTDPQTYITIGGVQVGAKPAVAAQHVVDGTLEVIETEGATPNTASFQVMGLQPTDGQEVIMTQGSKNNLDRLFAGVILTDAHNYVGTPASYNERIHVIDFTWLLTRDTFSQKWQTISATVIAQDIIAKAAGRGVTSTYVAAGLPVLDEFSVTNKTPAQALDALADRIGATWQSTYRSPVAGARSDVRFGITTDTLQTDPTTLTLASAALTRMENFSVTRDLSQVITRQAVEGGGANSLADLSAGETSLPITEAPWYNVGGGTVVSGPQRIAYTGVQAGGGGALVGPGAAPSTAPTLTVVAGTGLGLGVYQGAYTDVTAAGESLPSPLGSVATFDAPTPATPIDSGDPNPEVANLNLGAGGRLIAYKVSFGMAASPSDFTRDSLASGVMTTTTTASAFFAGYNKGKLVTLTYSNDVNVKWIRLWRDNSGTGGAGTYDQAPLIADQAQHAIPGASGNSIPNVPGGGTITIIDASAGVLQSAPTGSAHYNQIAVAGIAIGAPGTTSRNVYRTAVGGSQLKLQQVIADNAATAGVTDATADGSLGANAPTSDTSGLTFVASVGPGFASGSGVTFSTNGAATVATSAAPVFTSASYTFVAADVGAKVFIKSGTNWITGSYTIVSVAAGAATLDRACASVASPTTATWGVDYSGVSAARSTRVDLVIDATTATKVTSAAIPFTVADIGNALHLTSGLGFIVQWVTVVSISGSTATCDKTLGTLSSTGGIGALGGAPPATFVSAGSTTLPLASAAAFSAGWAIAGSQVIKYTGVSGNTLTGIPASGSGSIGATIPYNTIVVAAAALTGIPASGVGSILYAIKRGDPVNLRVVIDDLTAQVAVTALMSPTVDDGIIEGTVIQEGTISETEARAQGTAQLALRSAIDVAITYTTRDKNTHASRTIGASLAAPTSVSGSFKLQSVTIDGFTPGLWPTHHAHGANKRFTLEDLLRIARGA